MTWSLDPQIVLEQLGSDPLQVRPEQSPAEGLASPDGEAEQATGCRHQQDILGPIKRQLPWLPEA